MSEQPIFMLISGLEAQAIEAEREQGTCSITGTIEGREVTVKASSSMINRGRATGSTIRCTFKLDGKRISRDNLTTQLIAARRIRVSQAADQALEAQEGKRQVGTIDCTPSWASVIEACILALECGTPTGRAAAKDQLRSLAKRLDDAKRPGNKPETPPLRSGKA